MFRKRTNAELENIGGFLASTELFTVLFGLMGEMKRDDYSRDKDHANFIPKRRSPCR
jgi:hypothetical protein